MDRLDAIQLFVRVVERGSFSAAAQEIGIGQSAVSKQIAGLEARLGSQLLHRSSRGLSLTEPGQLFYEGATRLTEDFSALESRIRLGTAEATGLLRIAVAPVFGRLYIIPHLPLLLDRYPALHIELIASDRHVNLVEEKIDIAIRHGALGDSSLTSRRLASSPLVTVASPDYLARNGAPVHPSEIDEHPCIAFTGGAKLHPWEFCAPDGSISTVLPQARIRTNDGEQLRAALLAGMGIAQAPAWLIGPELVSGALKPILQDFNAGELAISAVYLTKRNLAIKVRVFLDFLANTLAQDLVFSSPKD